MARELSARPRSFGSSRWAGFLRPGPIGIGLIVISFLLHVPTLDQPLLEHQSFRQTQTAYTALSFYQEGIDLFRPQMPVFGPPFVFPIEFPIFQALASLVLSLGVAPDVAVRLTALSFFLITAVLIWRLIVRVAGHAAGLAGLAVFLFSPLGLLVSRMSLIEYLVTAASLAFILFSLEWHERKRWALFAGAVLAGTIAMLVKPTTAFMYFVPVLALAFASWRESRLPVSSVPKYTIALGVLFGAPVFLGGAWTLYADGVRASNEATAWFSASGDISSFIFGTLAQKLDPSTWFALIEEAGLLLFGTAIWLWSLLGVVAGWAARKRLFSLALVVSGALGPLIFTNLYLAQDYYLAAISPFVAIVIGLGSGWLWQQRRQPVTKVMIASLAIGWLVTLHLTQGYWGRQFAGVFDQGQILPAAGFVAANSQPDDLVILTGQDWNPAVLYYARRKGFMVRGSLGPDDLPRFWELGYVSLFYCPPETGTCEVSKLGD